MQNTQRISSLSMPYLQSCGFTTGKSLVPILIPFLIENKDLNPFRASWASALRFYVSLLWFMCVDVLTMLESPTHGIFICFIIANCLCGFVHEHISHNIWEQATSQISCFNFVPSQSTLGFKKSNTACYCAWQLLQSPSPDWVSPSSCNHLGKAFSVSLLN